jgi:4-amino-4-deoxy-L-arabinose transferase-like glycosyltransferase
MGQQSSPLKLKNSVWLALFMLIGFALRVQQLNFQPLWGDEGWSFYFAAQPVPQLIALTAIDIHPPLYYLLLKGWLTVTGFSPESARFLSVLSGTLLIPVLGNLGRRLFDRRVGAATAAVVAVMPLAVYYSQEVRMYGLVTLLAAVSTYSFTRINQSKWRVVYIAATTAAMYTMYYAAFVVLFQLLYRLIMSPARPPKIIQRLRAFFFIGLLYLPWILYAGPRLLSYIQNKRTVEGYLPLNIVRFGGDHFVAFSVGHLSEPLLGYAWIALPMALLAALGIAAALSRSRRVWLYPTLYLGVPMLAGYLVNQIYPFTPAYYERTLLLAAPAWWLLIGAGIIWLWDRQYLLVGTAVMGMLLAAAVSLTGFYTVPRYPQEDYRPMLKDIAARATPADTLLASYQWQLGFYHAYLPKPPPRLYSVPAWGQDWAGNAGQAQCHADVTAIFSQSPRLWFPAHQALGHQWEDEAEAIIAGLGYPARLAWYSPQTKLTLAGRSVDPMIAAATGNFANLLALPQSLVGQGPFEAGRGIVPVQLTWQKQGNLGREHRVNLRLVDPTGRTWASRDSHPLAGQIHFTDLTNGESLTDRHGLLIPAGTPPGRYRLLLSVRRVSDAHPLDLLDAAGQPLGAELPLTEIEVVRPSPPVGPDALPVEVSRLADFGPTVQLRGYSLGRGPFKAGETLPLTLFWQALTVGPPELQIFVELQNLAGEQVMWYQRPPVWASNQWQPGDLTRDPHNVPLPPTLSPGNYRLRVGLLAPEQIRLPVNGGDSLLLTTIATIDRPHNFESTAPQHSLDVNFGGQVSLTGLDLPMTRPAGGETLPLTLHWRTIETPVKSWTVFVHLMDEAGQIVSQQDQIPGGGQFSTTGWLPGEVLTDSYRLQLPVDMPPGRYRLRIGLYDTNDFSRLPVMDDGQVVGDHVVLENWPITVQ